MSYERELCCNNPPNLLGFAMGSGGGRAEALCIYTRRKKPEIRVLSARHHHGLQSQAWVEGLELGLG